MRERRHHARNVIGEAERCESNAYLRGSRAEHSLIHTRKQNENCPNSGRLLGVFVRLCLWLTGKRG